ncbi:MAG: bifunctional hydroxymethylpyrimidine kinase/phosphomethylpyrimidine kinase [Kiritimatiellae bacterium]|nr:bifunctional hydroxymethylpyrimidine kinase/phosphomethylpyrimidine kinase [Kiritimatiellia bacterium]MBP5228387.1 bifunctional hydroxymethylpyrimidine kinase/phosphomethylpyrimidine kinase [Kiritimatiellia bacterium]
MTEKRLLTIQDISCVGQCSLTVALPVISACGVECAILPSAVLSNHTGGFPSWTFRDLTDELAKIEAKWRELGIGFDAFYTGYVCQAQIDPILSIMRTCANPGAIRVVDPVMADNGKLYPGFEADFPAQMARLCEGADYILPNLTEAAFLVGWKPVLDGYAPDYIEALIGKLHQLGAKHVVLTGVSFESGLLGTAVSDGESIAYDFNPRLARVSHGTGDVFASVFAGAILRGQSPLEAAALAADMVCASIQATPDSHWYGVAFEQMIPELAQRLKG